MDKITDEIYREYLTNRLKTLTDLCNSCVMSAENRLYAHEQMDHIMFQLYQLDNAEPEE